jgi:hypothetical protein
MEPKGRLARWILDSQEFNFTVVHRAGRLHTNADALSRLVQSPGEQQEQASATATTTCHNSPASTESEVVKTTVKVKLSSGRTVLITFEGSKPLETDSTGALVTVESNACHMPVASHSNIANVSSTINENTNISEGISCAFNICQPFTRHC